jgi:PHD/YefM family antitoxin component YafN of YafNO toxin-antitoxin module
MSNVQETYSISEIREEITRLLEHFKQEPEPEAVTVTDNGKPVMAILPWQLYELITQAVKSKRLPH